MPTKWLCDLDERLFLAAALGALFSRLDMPHYADMCTADSTAEIIASYEHAGRAAGLKAYRAALAASGLQPPDLPGVLVGGSVMGVEEAAGPGNRRRYAQRARGAFVNRDDAAVRPRRAYFRTAPGQRCGVTLLWPR